MNHPIVLVEISVATNSPDEVEEGIGRPIESALKAVPNVSGFYSNSSHGSYAVEVAFDQLPSQDSVRQVESALTTASASFKVKASVKSVSIQPRAQPWTEPN